MGNVNIFIISLFCFRVTRAIYFSYLLEDTLTINLRKQLCTADSIDIINGVGAVHEVQMEILSRRDYLRT